MRTLFVTIFLAIGYFSALRIITGEWIPFSDLIEYLKDKRH
jgi:hypothetical protein